MIIITIIVMRIMMITRNERMMIINVVTMIIALTIIAFK